jgi:hypothetical protein
MSSPVTFSGVGPPRSAHKSKRLTQLTYAQRERRLSKPKRMHLQDEIISTEFKRPSSKITAISTNVKGFPKQLAQKMDQERSKKPVFETRSDSVQVIVSNNKILVRLLNKTQYRRWATRLLKATTKRFAKIHANFVDGGFIQSKPNDHSFRPYKAYWLEEGKKGLPFNELAQQLKDFVRVDSQSGAKYLPFSQQRTQPRKVLGELEEEGLVDSKVSPFRSNSSSPKADIYMDVDSQETK